MSSLRDKFIKKLFPDGNCAEEFSNCLTRPQRFPRALIWQRDRPMDIPWETLPPLPWQPTFVDRVAATEDNVGRHKLHDEGYYYVLDFSSVFSCIPLLQIAPRSSLIIDVCASPGGKSFFAIKALRPEKIVCNEVIGKRTAALKANIKRLKATEAEALSMDPEILATKFANQAGLVIVDAPCSGQSLLAKGKKADGCFHPLVISRNAKRQRRILANSQKLLAPGGFLLYSTCTFSPEENEENVEWLIEKFPHLKTVQVGVLSEYQSNLTNLFAYRLWPMNNLGAGAFCSLFIKD